MEQIFLKDFYRENFLTVEAEEHVHLKALRMKVGSKVLVTNGQGLSAICEVLEFSKTFHKLEVIQILEKFGELEQKITLCLGLLSNKDRLEFALEKAVELGVQKIVLLKTDFSEEVKINVERLNAKLIAALKQSKRSILPVLEIVDFDEFFTVLTTQEKTTNFFPIVADSNGKSINEVGEFLRESYNESRSDISNEILIFVGPEGGFSEKELKKIQNLPKCNSLRLSNTRLRAETAVVSSISLIINSL